MKQKKVSVGEAAVAMEPTLELDLDMDFTTAMETYAEAWVAANTQTAVTDQVGCCADESTSTYYRSPTNK